MLQPMKTTGIQKSTTSLVTYWYLNNTCIWLALAVSSATSIMRCATTFLLLYVLSATLLSDLNNPYFFKLFRILVVLLGNSSRETTSMFIVSSIRVSILLVSRHTYTRYSIDWFKLLLLKFKTFIQNELGGDEKPSQRLREDYYWQLCTRIVQIVTERRIPQDWYVT